MLLEEDPGREARADVGRVAAALARALGKGGYEVAVLAVGPNPADIVAPLNARTTDLVLNLCESIGGDARGEMAVPALLDLLGLPYSGSGALALGLALHKDKAKELLVARGVPTPAFRVVERLARLEDVGPFLSADCEALPRGRVGRGGLRLGGGGRAKPQGRGAPRAPCLQAAGAGGAVRPRPRGLRLAAGELAPRGAAAVGDPLRGGLLRPSSHRELSGQVGVLVTRVHRQPLGSLHPSSGPGADAWSRRRSRVRGARMPGLWPRGPASLRRWSAVGH